jgi:hypothetical protein
VVKEYRRVVPIVLHADGFAFWEVLHPLSSLATFEVTFGLLLL